VAFPVLFERLIAHFGWQTTMLAYGIFTAPIIMLLAVRTFVPPPALQVERTVADGERQRQKVLGMRPNVTLGLLSFCLFLCCVPMAMPASHLIAAS